MEHYLQSSYLHIVAENDFVLRIVCTSLWVSILGGFVENQQVDQKILWMYHETQRGNFGQYVPSPCRRNNEDLGILGMMNDLAWTLWTGSNNSLLLTLKLLDSHR